MTWYRVGSQWRTRPADEVLEVCDYFITTIGGYFHLHLVKVDGIADCGRFVSLAGAKGYAEQQPQYAAS